MDTVIDRRPPAPGDLALVQAFVNTLHKLGDEDDFDTPEHMAHWLQARGLHDGARPITEADWQRVRVVREALRHLLLANNGAHLADEPVAALNAAAQRAPVIVHFDHKGHAGMVAAAPDSIDRVIGHVLGIVATAMVNGTWHRLKACREERCQWAFYDTSKNQGGVWCTMNVCGSRHKARSYRRRRRVER